MLQKIFLITAFGLILIGTLIANQQKLQSICPQWQIVNSNQFGNCGCESAINTQYTNNDPTDIVSATCGNFVPFECYQVVGHTTQWVCGYCSKTCKGTQVDVQINDSTTKTVVVCTVCDYAYLPL